MARKKRRYNLEYEFDDENIEQPEQESFIVRVKQYPDNEKIRVKIIPKPSRDLEKITETNSPGNQKSLIAYNKKVANPLIQYFKQIKIPYVFLPTSCQAFAELTPEQIIFISNQPYVASIEDDTPLA